MPLLTAATGTVINLETPFAAQLDQFDCTGQETRLSQCQYLAGNFGCNTVPGVFCGGTIAQLHEITAVLQPYRSASYHTITTADDAY